MKKIELGKTLFTMHIAIFRCPICSGQIFFNEFNTVHCERNHCFDLSSKGALNFLLGNKKVPYNKELFINRRAVFISGLFTPLLSEISSVLSTRKSGVIVDAGCGEGSALSSIISKLPPDSIGIGVDIAKEGVALATDYPNILWFVGDLSALPLQDNSVDCIVNILSPANYQEFKRVLKPDGTLIKVIPGKAYLHELRTHFYGTEATYTDETVIAHFLDHMALIDKKEMQYHVPTDKFMLKEIMTMTPLTWHVPEEKKNELTHNSIPEITMSYTILIGTIKNLDS